MKPALAGVAQWIEWQPAKQGVAGLIPSQGACLGCRPEVVKIRIWDPKYWWRREAPRKQCKRGHCRAPPWCTERPPLKRTWAVWAASPQGECHRHAHRSQRVSFAAAGSWGWSQTLSLGEWINEMSGCLLEYYAKIRNSELKHQHE